MSNISVFFLGVIISLALVHGGEGNIQLAANSNQIFSRNFFAEVGLEETGNVICSPLSAHLALGMTRLGARGNTRNQLTQKLGLGQDEDDNKQAFIQLRNQLLSENTDDIVLRIANKLYAANSLQLNTDFERNALEIFDAKPSSVDFGEPNTRLIINQWVQNVTQDKIQDLIQEGVLDRDTLLVLVNALYFKGLWKTAFDRNRTTERNFYLDNQQEVKIPFMFQKGQFKMSRFFPDLNASVLELPYKSDNFSLVIVMPTLADDLPKDPNYWRSNPSQFSNYLNQMERNEDIRPINQIMTLSELERVIRTRDLGEILDNTRRTDKLEVYLPKFTMELALDLQVPLTQMGISEIFDRRADLSGISNVRNIFVSKVVQKSFIEITEEGTEAAAATYAQFVSKSAARNLPSRFEVNRPFLFYLVHRQTSNTPPIILFSGRYVTPPPTNH